MFPKCLPLIFLILTIFIILYLLYISADENPLKDLYVITAIFNPASYKSRTDLYFQFEEHMRNSTINLITIECIYGNNSEFVVTESNNTNHIQLRTNQPLWHKENLINIAIRRLPSNWKYVLWLDADIEFQESDWPLRVIESFNKYDIIQVFKYVELLGPYKEILKAYVSHTFAIVEDLPITKQYYYLFWPTPGYGWGMTRRAYEYLDGIIEHGILGGGDSMMAYSLIGRYEESTNIPIKRYSKSFGKQIKQWQEKVKVFRDYKKIGYADCVIKHYFHGYEKDRQYKPREKILVNGKFDPENDLYTDENGLLQLKETKKKMIDLIYKYFASRNEDIIISTPIEAPQVRTLEEILNDALEKKKLLEHKKKKPLEHERVGQCHKEYNPYKRPSSKIWCRRTPYAY